MKKMENKKNIIIGCLIGGLVVLAGVIFAITSNKESKTNETLQTTGDIKKMLKTIYKNLANELPELTTEEINLKESELVESLTGLKSTDDINTLVVSEPVMGSQALEVAVIKTKEKTDITSMMQNIKDNVDMSRWICVSAEKLYIVNSGDVIFMVMADSDWAKSIYDEFVKNEIYDVCVVVTRYFGGVLLGTGGLVRAYSHGAKIALDAAKIVMMQNCLVCSARCTYNRYGKVSALVTDNGGAVDDTVYEGDVLIKFHIKPDLLLQLNKKLADATAGEVQAVFDEEKYYAVEL